MGILSTDARFSVAAGNSKMLAVQLQLHTHVNARWLLVVSVDNGDVTHMF